MPDAQGVHGPKVPASPQPLQLPVQEKEAEQEDEVAAEAFWTSLFKDSEDEAAEEALARDTGLQEDQDGEDASDDDNFSATLAKEPGLD
jgi:hypothetical protein